VIGNVQYKLIEMSIGAEVNGKLIHESEGAGIVGKSASRPQIEAVSAGEV
jgi:cytoskeletal protein CcmA (bactofilin family)